jgi:hypothetical protein
MWANPKPDKIIAIGDCNGAHTNANPSRPIFANILEM